jgi:acetyl-CoA acyltransferase
MRQAVIVEAVRTPIGRRQKALSSWRADDLGALAVRRLLERVDLDPALVEEVVFGCVMQVGEQSINVARKVALLAGLPTTTSGVTLDYQCGSGLKALQLAAAQVETGLADVVVAGGTETMTRVPLGSTGETYGDPIGDALADAYDFPTNGASAELVAQRWNLRREELDELSAASHARAAAATDEGRFAREIVPVPYPGEDGSERLLEHDEGIRRDTSAERLGALKPAFAEDGMVTAGSASQISDGAAAILVMERELALALGLRPRARIRASVSLGSDPTLGLTGPIDATREILRRSGATMEDVALFEVNEAFAPVVLAWQRELGADLDRVNVNGGAIALGHPLGSSGARLVTTLLHELERRDEQLGLATLCCNGGLGIASLIDRDV